MQKYKRTEIPIKHSVARRFEYCELTMTATRSSLRRIYSVLKLEEEFGDSMRASGCTKPEEVRRFLQEEHGVLVSEQTAKTWLQGSWPRRGVSTKEDLEAKAGNRLRLDQYRKCFTNAEKVQELSEDLLESDPKVEVCSEILLEWYNEYHPDSGPLKYKTAEEMEKALGDELRDKYYKMKYRPLTSALGKRKKAVLISQRTCRTWLANFASWMDTDDEAEPRPKKRIRVSRGRQAKIKVSTPEELESICGCKYRREVSDLGLGMTKTEMKNTLYAWKIDASMATCAGWLTEYRLGDGAKDAGAGVFDLNRENLQRWYHLEGLRGEELTDRYRQVNGIYTEPPQLEKWLNAAQQALPSLENNESMHMHRCGGFALKLLQEGITAKEVVAKLLDTFLIKTTEARVCAYRRFREQTGANWSRLQLEDCHWKTLYAECSQESSLAAKNRQGENERMQTRTSMCHKLGIDEEVIPMEILTDFFGTHERWAKLPFEYPSADVVPETCASKVVDMYRETFKQEALPATTTEAMQKEAVYQRTRKVASKGVVVLPKRSAENCCVAAYATLKCEELFAKQVWTRSQLQEVQRRLPRQYPATDFHFWVMYGSWSQCENCASFYFNDKFFSNCVHDLKSTKATPEMMATSRRYTPGDPAIHGEDNLSSSSHWWYLPGMFKPAAKCERCIPIPAKEAGAFLSARLRMRSKQSPGKVEPVKRTGELYRIPRLRQPTENWEAWSPQCITWPRYEHGLFSFQHKNGPSMLDLTVEEAAALRIVTLKCSLKKETYGASHQCNYKKIGLSKAYFEEKLRDESNMPTDMAKAAYRFLMANNEYYKNLQHQRAERLAAGINSINKYRKYH